MGIARAGSTSGGFTLIEMAVSVVVLGLLMSVFGLITVSGHNAYRATTLSNKADGSARRAIARISSELTTAGGSVMNPDPTSQFGVQQIDFQQATGVLNGNVTWGPVTRIGFEYAPGETDDGVDNDGNGLVDDGVVAMTRDLGGPNQQRVVLCHGIRELGQNETLNGVDDNGNGVIDESGFNAQRVGDVMILRLCVELPGAGDGTVVRPHQATVRLRNIDI
jgi:prepilin-type N-terminal cleavage/methylation domain-containing protein